jgi:hypothetical protein
VRSSKFGTTFVVKRIAPVFMIGNVFTCTISGFIEYETFKLCQLRAKSNERLKVFGGSGRTLLVVSFEPSKMYFRKTNPPSGCSAIAWNENFLLFDTHINIHNSLQENELEEK